MKAYAIAHLRDVDFNEQIAEYLRRIDATLKPYGGRFLIHGGQVHPLEGDFDAALVVVEFPDLDAARSWYQSPGYQAILPLRTDNSRGIAFFVEGVPTGYRGADKLAPR